MMGNLLFQLVSWCSEEFSRIAVLCDALGNGPNDLRLCQRKPSGREETVCDPKEVELDKTRTQY